MYRKLSHSLVLSCNVFIILLYRSSQHPVLYLRSLFFLYLLSESSQSCIYLYISLFNIFAYELFGILRITFRWMKHVSDCSVSISPKIFKFLFQSCRHSIEAFNHVFVALPRVTTLYQTHIRPQGPTRSLDAQYLLSVLLLCQELSTYALSSAAVLSFLQVI